MAEAHSLLGLGGQTHSREPSHPGSGVLALEPEPGVVLRPSPPGLGPPSSTPSAPISPSGLQLPLHLSRPPAHMPPRPVLGHPRPPPGQPRTLLCRQVFSINTKTSVKRSCKPVIKTQETETRSLDGRLEGGERKKAEEEKESKTEGEGRGRRAEGQSWAWARTARGSRGPWRW